MLRADRANAYLAEWFLTPVSVLTGCGQTISARHHCTAMDDREITHQGDQDAQNGRWRTFSASC